ncbi:hypothetical protein PSAL_014810 [Pseudooceanicola algae]|uniref:N-acetyltransferase domain-containing protein n=2 Tax=Pseudooceanicola algae TaxID=1537215 RepID=A0A418SHR8_9RHOB|nr:hypothetical protein PSAL_014810 [Pseudooceanicola algae]
MQAGLKAAQAQCPPGQRLALAGPKDFDALAAISAEAAAFVGLDVFGLQDAAFFASIRERGAVILQILRHDIPEGYSVVGPAAQMAGLFAGEDDKGLLFGTALRAGLRGQGWQRRMIRLRCAALFAAGFGGAKAFVSPWNHASLTNLLGDGFAVVSHDFSYYQRHRFIVERPAKGWGALGAGETQALTLPPDGDLEDHRHLLASGWRGMDMARPQMLYRR